MATINSLGIGSGVLTSDIIDKLKANDTSNLITPIDNKITLQKQKGDALNLLSSLLTSFKGSVNALDDDTLYQKRSVSGNNSDISVTAEAGVSVQSFSLTDTKLALQNVQESGQFNTADAFVSTGFGTMKLSVGGTNYNIDYTSSTTLEGLRDSINNTAGSDIRASVLQVGANDYRLVFTSSKTGLDQNILIADSTGGSLNNSLVSYKKIESQSFATPLDKVASGAGTLTVSMGTTDYLINYDQNTSLENLRDLINVSIGSDAASIDGTNRLILRTSIAGSTTPFTLSDTGALDPKLMNYTVPNTIEEIQAGRDATFKYNGIAISRSSNEISDVLTGATISLLKENGSANISISQDVQAISDVMGSFVQSYNTLTSQLNDMTTTDVAAGKVGIFNGDSSINGITREINRLVTSISSNGYALPQFGIDISQTGTMNFNQTTFKSKFNENITSSEAFLSGMTTVASNGTTTVNNGVFTSLNQFLNRYTKSNGLMSTLTTGSSDQIKSLQTNRTSSLNLLNARYESMSARFAQYDSMISKLTNQFNSLQQQISMAINGTNG